MYLNNDRHVVKSTPNNILTFQRINSNEIKIYEINNSKNKELLKNEEDFEKIVNDLDISLYSKINLVNQVCNTLTDSKYMYKLHNSTLSTHICYTTSLPLQINATLSPSL